MPGAALRLLPPGVNHSSGGMGQIHGVVIHVIVGSLGAADGAFHKPTWRASAHFGVGKDGHVIQWVDTADKAWAEGAGNPNWISVETEGVPTEPLTDAQLSACARIVRWAHDNHVGFYLQVTDSPTGYGVGTHQMGGAAWGGHACPGAIRANQRGEIVRRASGAAPQPQPAPSPPAPQRKRKTMYVAFAPEDATNARWLCDGKRVRWWIQTNAGLVAYVRIYGPEQSIPIKDLAAIPVEGPHP